VNRSFPLRRASIVALFALLYISPSARAQRDAAPGRIDETIEVHLDIAYADTDHERQRLDLYLPKVRKTDQPLPVIAFIHGGAWLGGDKRGGADPLRSFVASGRFAGVSIGYRLSQHAQWPAQIHDCKAAIRWIRAHAKEHNLDPERIGVIGGSAGGHLVALLGTSGGMEDLEGDLGRHTDQSSSVTCVVDFFGPSDFLTIADYPSNLDHAAADSPEARLLGGRIADKQDAARHVSPVTYVSNDDPPFLIVHGTNDMTVPYNQSERLRDVLREAGVEVALISVEGGGHGGFESDRLEEQVRKFFAKHLYGEEAEFEDETVR
jgi:acetyl esterase/lipase